MVQEWECLECSHVEEGSRAPARCPECGAPRNRFQVLDMLEEDEDEALDLLDVDDYDEDDDEEDLDWDDDEDFLDDEDDDDY